MSMEKNVVWFLNGIFCGRKGRKMISKFEFDWLKEIFKNVSEDNLKEICKDYFRLENINGKLYIVV